MVSNGKDEFVALLEATDIKKIRPSIQEVKNDAKHVAWETTAYVDSKHELRKGSKRLSVLFGLEIGLIIVAFAYFTDTCYLCRLSTKVDSD